MKNMLNVLFPPVIKKQSTTIYVKHPGDLFFTEFHVTVYLLQIEVKFEMCLYGTVMVT